MNEKLNGGKEITSLPSDLSSLLERYKTDRRFEGKEHARSKCIEGILQLNTLLQTTKLPTNIKAILLTGSLSEKNQLYLRCIREVYMQVN